ncbi:aspartate aminotransferase family protein [Rathayibacter sp. VKM Ac-2857]|nr:aspartate aminotransferase family protein [Rathayibacter sp. VKM Ac-2857]
MWPALVTAGEPVFRAVSADGVHVTGTDGRRYLCADSGLWNVPLGYGNRAVAGAVAQTLVEASYLPLFRSSHLLAEQAADALLDRAGGRYARVLFSTSGGAANDAVMKLARHFWRLRGAERRIVVGLEGSYHGLTQGAHALSGDALLQDLYAVDRRGVRHVPVHDGGDRLARLLEREGDRVAALVLEPVLGSGCVALPDDLLCRVQELRERYGFLLVADEVATGFHRTGPLFASDFWDPAPDVLVLSKALTNGTCAAAAVLVGDSVVSAFDEAGAVFVHGETQAGSPPTCAAVLATLAEFDRLHVADRSAALAVRLDGVLDELQRTGLIHSSSGAGCFRAARLRGPDGALLGGSEVAALVAEIREAGALVHPGPSAIQLVPALVFEAEHVDELARCLRTVRGRRDMRSPLPTHPSLHRRAR